MVNTASAPKHLVNRRNSASLLIELLVAMGVVAIAMLPIMASYLQIQKSIQRSYQRAVAIELIDGEMEILMAGQWREFQPGSQLYPLHGIASANLPPGHSTLTINGNRVRLEWLPEKLGEGGSIVREGTAK